jgi:hypothetical protein
MVQQGSHPGRKQKGAFLLRVIMSYDAFISYSRANLPVVEVLKRSLDGRGLRAFLALADLRAGREWPPQLGRALQRSRMMVLCWSADAAASEWVLAEINYCLLAKKPVLPWLLDSTPLPTTLQQTQGVAGKDPAPVVDLVADRRSRHRVRLSIAGVATAALLVPALWLG